jgi:hypothetical protein
MFDEGSLSGMTITGTPPREQDWTLDSLGNWTDFVVEANNTVTLNQDRTHNGANEIGPITATVGINWDDPTHDAAGNMTRFPQRHSPGKALDATYDAWNRLVKIVDRYGHRAERAVLLAPARLCRDLQAVSIRGRLLRQ